MRAELTRSPRRDGALQGAGMLLGAWLLAWRDHGALALALRVAAGGVLALALLRPASLRALNHALGRAVTWALLIAVYALALLPTRAALALLRVDPLEPGRAPSDTHWITRERAGFTPEDMERTA